MRIVEEKEHKIKNKTVTKEKHAKREASITEFNKRIGEKTRENEKKQLKSVEYAKHKHVFDAMFFFGSGHWNKNEDDDYSIDF